MSSDVNSTNDLFLSNSESKKTYVNMDKSSGRAGAAQKSARSKKSSSAFRTISEVAEDLGVQQHVLRFWETKFSQIKPLKRGGGRRYYRPEDVSLLQAIHNLLYVEGYTIKGVQKLIRDVGKKQIVDSFSNDVDKKIAKGSSLNVVKTLKSEDDSTSDNNSREVLETVLSELKELRGMIKPRG